MAKKPRMGRNVNALLSGAIRNRVSSNSEPAETNPVETISTDNKFTDNKSTDSKSTDSKSAESSSAEASAVERIPAQSTTAESVKDSANVSVESSLNTEAPANKLETGLSVDLPATTEATRLPPDSHPTDRLRMLGVDQITRGTYQPRRHFDQDLLQELADSIKAQGLIQPILVRAYGGKFELIAGERRWRASQLAGITDIPAIVRDMDDQSVAAVSLIENIQRADLNPLEEAQALERLCGEFSMTHQQVAEAVGRSRVAVTNLMRLLELHEDVKLMVDNGELDMGHARALLGAPTSDQPEIAKRITQQGLTVRAVEKMVKDLREGKTTSTAGPAKPDPNIDALGQKLGKLLGAPVTIRHQKSGAGKLEITYSSIDELEGILKHIK